MLRTGERIDRYEVVDLIGQGGLAEVYKVRHIELGSIHALKLLIWKRQSLANRLVLEGRIQAQLKHPNVVAVTDLIRHEGHIGLLMEYVDHLTLQQYLEEHGPLRVADALELMAPILSGVAAAHDASVLHRDLKPANIMLARTSMGLVPKVTDFGIAKVVREDMDSQGTATGVAMGTPGYLAPEQVLDSADADARADIFALGAILHELLTGKRAFADDQGQVVVRSTLLREATDLSDILDDCPDTVARAVGRALSRERDQRFDDIAQFAAALYEGYPDLLAQVQGQSLTGPLSFDPSVPALELDRTVPPLEPRGGDDEQTFGEHLELVQPDGEVSIARVNSTVEQVATPQRKHLIIAIAIAAALILGVVGVGVFVGWGNVGEQAVQAPGSELVGKWAGETHDGMPLDLSIQPPDETGTISAMVSMTSGEEQRIGMLKGSYFPEQGRIELMEVDGSLIFVGTVDGNAIEGTYRVSGGDKQKWRVSRVP